MQKIKPNPLNSVLYIVLLIILFLVVDRIVYPLCSIQPSNAYHQEEFIEVINGLSIILKGIIGFLILKRLLWYFNTTYQISIDRINIKAGEFSIKSNSFDVGEIVTLSSKQSFIEVYFNTGTLLITYSDGYTYELKGVPDIDKLITTIRPFINKRKLVEIPNYNQHFSSDSNQQKIVVNQKSGSGCSGCLVVILIIIFLPTILAFVFHVTVFVTLMEFIKGLLHH